MTKPRFPPLASQIEYPKPGLVIFDSKIEDFEILANQFSNLPAKPPRLAAQEFFEKWQTEVRDYPSKDDHQKNPSGSNDKSWLKAGALDYLAWYSPATFHSKEKYGIFFECANILTYAQFLEIYGEGVFTGKEILPLILYTVLCHEVAHAWVEDVCCLIDRTINRNTDQKSYRENFKGYIEDEEAFCSTVAYWMLNAMVNKLVEDRPRDSSKYIAMKKSIKWGMEQSPTGYCDYDTNIGAYPNNLGRLVDRFITLLHKWYGHCDSSAREAVLIFLYLRFSATESKCFPMYKKIHEQDINNYFKSDHSKFEAL